MVALPELLNNVLLTYFLEEVYKLPCQLLDVSLKPQLTIGDATRVPKLTKDTLEELAAAPLPVPLAGGRACALHAKDEILGYAVLATETEEDGAAADFVFQLLEEQCALAASREESEFDANYLKNLISIMQRLFQRMATVFDSRKAAELFIKECQKLFAAKSGAVVTIENKELRLLASFGSTFDDFDIVGYACFSGQPLICNDVATDPRFVKTDDAGNQKRAMYKNVLIMPLQSGEKILGAIYLCDKETGPFWDDDQRMAQTLGAVLGSAIANIHLHETLVENERVKSNLERYLSPNLVKEIIEGGGIPQLGGSRVDATILFSDIRGFTKLSEKHSPEQMVAQLNEYFEEMSKVIFAFDGTLDKYVGDLIMVLFGVPKPMSDAAERAVKTALAMQERLVALNAKWSREGRATFGVGIGINRGNVVFGNIGSSHAMGLTVIGDHVNRAQRLEAYAKAGEILISDTVYSSVKTLGFATTALGQIESKGKTLEAYRVASKAD